MEKHILEIEVDWADGNFCCGWGDPEVGVIMATARDLDKLKANFAESLGLQLESCLRDGANLPDWLVQGEYSLDFRLSAAALLREAERYTTLTAISRACGINAKQLSHYAAGLKKPRQAQRERIMAGLRFISRQVMALR